MAHRLDAVGQVALDQRARRQVDRDADVETLRAPGAHLAQRVVEHVVGQRDDEAGVLGQRDELVGRQPAVHGVRPAQQHLGARHRIGAQVDLGLVVQDELLALERRAQVAGQGQALHAVAVELGDVALDPGAPLLGLVHGDVGALHEHVDVLAVLGEGGDADAGAELQAHAGDVEVLGDGAPDGGRDGDAGGRRLDRAQEDRELVAAQARDGVVLAAAGPRGARRPGAAPRRRSGGRGCR